MNCPNCLRENDDKNKFCFYCGESLVQAKETQSKIEQLKQRSRELAAKPGTTDFSQWVRWLNERPASYKSYPALVIVRVIYAGLGWLLLIGGLVYLSLTPQSLEGGNPVEGSRYIVAGIVMFVGLLCIASSEGFRLMMDMAENADRQSILLAMLYSKLSETPKAKN